MRNNQKIINIFIIIYINLIRNSKSQKEISGINICGSPTLKQCSSTSQCIPVYKFCDGEIHCKDGSDETPECRQIVMNCGKFNFQCNYGGCISKLKICNGTPDCIDKSDEDETLCSSGNEINNSTLTTVPIISILQCARDHFQCEPGKCIKQYLVCDGKYDCENQADETKALCKNQMCGRRTFQCDYGACISSFNKCNDKIDCVDSSDETFSLCGKVPPIAINTTTSKTTTPTQPILIPGKCYVPKTPNLVMYRGPIAGGKRLKPGDIVDPFPGRYYSYSCDNDLEIHSNNLDRNSVYCTGNATFSAWTNPNHPYCTKHCNGDDLKAVTFQSLCTDRTDDCLGKKWLNGTEAKFSCRFGYDKPNNFIEKITCNPGGKWSHKPKSCVALCGVTYGNTVAFLFNGTTNTDTLKVPWYAAIYRLDPNEENTEIYNFVCGGSIISAKLILTAAHCFWNEKQHRVIDAIEYKVAVGKSKRDFYAAEENSKRFSLSEIIAHGNYRGIEYDYNFDLALAVLSEPLKFSTTASPICINTTVSYDNRQIKTGVRGIFAGMGLVADRTKADLLQTANVTSLSNDDCKTKVKAAQTFPTDKFCLDYGNISVAQVCFGDSGGGFAELQKLPNNKGSRYFLRGVLSTGHYTIGCGDTHSFAGFTNIHESNYIPMIDDAFRRNPDDQTSNKKS